MKKFYPILIVISFLPAIANAQAYTPLLDTINIWHYSASPVVVRLAAPPSAASTPCTYPTYFWTTKTHYTVNDTIIDSLTYKIVREEADLNPNYCDFGYVREDTASRKVYFRDNAGNPEILLYDFSLLVGDTFPVTFLFQNGLYQSGDYILDSISSIMTVNGPTRLFCLNNHAVWSPTLYWTEGVGCMLNAFYPYSINQWGSGSMFWQCRYYPENSQEFLTCFDHAQKIYYDSCKYSAASQDICFMVTDTCNYWNICGAIDENELNATLDIFPNPASECIRVTIESNERSEFYFAIYDVNGNLVNESIPPMNHSGGEQIFSVDINDLSSGTYLLECSDGFRRTSASFIVQ